MGYKPVEIIYNELKDYYVDGKLRIWLSKDLSYDYWTIYDYHINTTLLVI